MRLRVNVQHELRERAMQPRETALEHGEARARELGRRLEIELAEAFTDVGVVLHREAERTRRSPASQLDVFFTGAPFRHFRPRQVRDGTEERIEPGLEGGERRFGGLYFI